MVSIAIRATLAALLAAAASAGRAQGQDELARGLYLVNGFGCADCHTPFKMGPKGPEPDVARGLSGHPQGLAMPAPPAAQGPWIGSLSATNTAFAHLQAMFVYLMSRPPVVNAVPDS